MVEATTTGEISISFFLSRPSSSMSRVSSLPWICFCKFSMCRIRLSRHSSLSRRLGSGMIVGWGRMAGVKGWLADRLPEMSLITSGSSLCISDTDGSRLDGKSKPRKILELWRKHCKFGSTDLRTKNIQPAQNQSYLDSLGEPMELLNSLSLPWLLLSPQHHCYQFD